MNYMKDFKQQEMAILSSSNQKIYKKLNEQEHSNQSFEHDEGNYFWIERLDVSDIRDFISMFWNEYKPPQNLWIERVNYNMDSSDNKQLADEDFYNN